MFISPSIFKDSFAGYSDMDWLLLSFGAEVHHSMLSRPLGFLQISLKLLSRFLPLQVAGVFPCQLSEFFPCSVFLPF